VDFCTYLAARNYSPFTIEHRVSTLSAFVAWLRSQDVDRAQDVTPDILEAYRLHLFGHRKANGEPLALRTQIVRLGAIRAFFKWLARERILASDPGADLELPRSERRLPSTILTHEEVEAVLAVPDITTPLGLRDRAILETLYVTGIRRLELTRLRAMDVDYARRVMLIRRGKGGKDRIVPTGERGVAWLAAYRDRARPRLVEGDDRGWLFVTSRGTPLRPRRLTDTISAYIAAAGINKKGSCHLFRHAAATHMLENGADIRFIQELLGHACLQTTQIYAHVSIGPLAAVHAATHPGALLKRAEPRLRAPDASFGV
jgi:integrase/recombinase XerD